MLYLFSATNEKLIAARRCACWFWCCQMPFLNRKAIRYRL